MHTEWRVTVLGAGTDLIVRTFTQVSKILLTVIVQTAIVRAQHDGHLQIHMISFLHKDAYTHV